ncbi:hypothetical protein EVAR_3885_1 [Eumeta japonica]|uniref:Uncharacterized protein n=1 Tax=Eumeta variegata TaxID=151549 RepID=A0A4C1STH4_EUMVA|nr:hypothetical protein EVAR_3885_1 [Eumeta japonica]
MESLPSRDSKIIAFAARGPILLRDEIHFQLAGGVGKKINVDITAEICIVRCRFLGEGDSPGELVYTLVSRNSSMRFNPESPAFRNDLRSRLNSWARGATISARKTVQKGSSRSVEYQVSSPSRHSVRAAPTLPSIRLRRCICATLLRCDGPKFGIPVPIHDSSPIHPVSDTCERTLTVSRYGVKPCCAACSFEIKCLLRYLISILTMFCPEQGANLWAGSGKVSQLEEFICHRKEKSQVPEDSCLAYVQRETIDARGLLRMKRFQRIFDLVPCERRVLYSYISKNYRSSEEKGLCQKGRRLVRTYYLSRVGLKQDILAVFPVSLMIL